MPPERNSPTSGSPLGAGRPPPRSAGGSSGPRPAGRPSAGSISSRSVKYGVTSSWPSSQRGEPAGQQRRTPRSGTSSPGTNEKVRYLWSADRVELDRQAGDGQELLQLAGEVEDAAVLDVVERADAERIADERQPAPLAVPPGGREGAVERVEAPSPAARRSRAARPRARRPAARSVPAQATRCGAVAVDARRLAGPAAPPAVAEADAGRVRRCRCGRRGSRWRRAWRRAPPGRPRPT